MVTIRIRTPRPELLCEPPKPSAMNGVNPRTIKGKEWWNETRRQAYKAAGGTCSACGYNPASAPLEAHEVYDVSWVEGKLILREVVALCQFCHTYIHRGIHRDSRHCNQKLYQASMKYCTKLLEDLGLKPLRTPRHNIPWYSWYLELEGKKYFPVHEEPR